MRAAIEKYFIPQDLLSAASLRIFRSKSVLDCVKDNFTTQVTPGSVRTSSFQGSKKVDIVLSTQQRARTRITQVA